MSEQRYLDELQAFAARLRKLRLEKGMVQLDFDSDPDGIDRSEISKLENAQKNFEFRTLCKIAETLGVELYEFFKPEEDSKESKNS